MTIPALLEQIEKRFNLSESDGDFRNLIRAIRVLSQGWQGCGRYACGSGIENNMIMLCKRCRYDALRKAEEILK